MKNIAALLFWLITLCGSFFSSAQEVKAGRAVQINIIGVPAEEVARINGMYRVADDGTVNMPLIGKVSIAGMQAVDAAAKIADKYQSAGVFSTPRIQILASTGRINGRPNSITVAGFVRKPGPMPFKPGITIFQAISDAGGVNEFGNMKRVIFMRGKNSETYDLNKVENQKIELQAGDTIEVSVKNMFVK